MKVFGLNISAFLTTERVNVYKDGKVNVDECAYDDASMRYRGNVCMCLYEGLYVHLCLRRLCIFMYGC